jgi:hypothetical protein
MSSEDQSREELASLSTAFAELEAKIDQQSLASPDVAGLLRESRRNFQFALLMAILPAITIVGSFIGLFANLDETLVESAGLVYLSMTLIAVVAVGLLFLSDRYRRASRAAGMRAFELAVFANYEQKLTTFQKQVLRMALAPRLFSGTSDRLDALTEENGRAPKS